MAGSVYCETHREREGKEGQKFADLAARIDRISSDGPKDRKDFWDKLSASSTMISGFIVGIIGIFATATYNNLELESQKAQQERSLQLRRVEIIQKFFPHLIGKEEAERRGALLAIAGLGDEKLAAGLAEHFGGTASQEVLTQLVKSEDPEVAQQARKILTANEIFASASNGLARLLIHFELGSTGERATATASGFFISKDGYLLTTVHVLETGGGATPVVQARYSIHDGPEFTSDMEIVDIDRDLDIALLRTKKPTVGGRYLEVSSQNPEMGQQLFSLGFLGRSPTPQFGRGLVVTKDEETGIWGVDLAIGPGYSGAPVLNADGQAVGIVVAAKTDRTVAYFRSLTEASELLAKLPY